MIRARTQNISFGALKEDGCVVAWGVREQGGDCSHVQGQLAGGVQAIHVQSCAFVARKEDGDTVAWGLVVKFLKDF